MSPVTAYVASVALDKGFSLISIPLVARYLTPHEFGRLEVASSVIEIVGLLLAIGAADTLVRFAGGARTDAERQGTLAQLFGTSLVLVFALGAAIQFVVPSLSAAAGVKVGDTAFRLGLLAATVTAFVEMPLVWLRLNERTMAFLCFIAVRSCVQVLAMWLVLMAGWGADGVLMANGLAVLAFALLLTSMQVRETGVVVGLKGLGAIVRYGLPLVGAGLSMFALGSLSRLFLAWHVSDAEIAYFGLALKMALIAPLLHQPFALWWNPRRIQVLVGPDGLKRSAEAWGVGVAVLVLGAMTVALGAPVLIQLALPASYAASTMLVAPLVLVCVLNELTTLCNVGTYSRDHGGMVLAVNVAGAIVGIVGYLLLARQFGVYGVIVSMGLGHLARLVLSLWVGHQDAPIKYPYAPATLIGFAAILSVVLAPDGLLPRLAWSAATFAAVAVLALQVGLLSLPGGLRWLQLKRGTLVSSRR